MKNPPTTDANTSQQGSIVVVLAITMVMLMALLGSIQIGYAAYQKRELQKTADMVALSAVQNLQTHGCDRTSAGRIAQENDKNLSALESDDMQCGTWSPEDGFVPATEDLNAVEISLSKKTPFPLLLNTDSEIHVIATATSSDPIAAFSVGSRLLRLLGIPVLDSDGIITISELLGLLDLDVGTPEKLFSAETNIQDLLDATVLAVGQNGTTADISAANEWVSIVVDKIDPNLTIPLFGQGGVFILTDTHNLQAALSSQVKLSDFADIGLTVANGDNFLDLPDLTLLGKTIDGKVRVVEPPAIAIGKAGTVAYSAVIRIYLNVSLEDKDVPGSILPPLGGLLGSLGTSITLQTIIDVAGSTATLENMCSPADKDRAEFKIERSLAKVCIGTFHNTDDFFDSGNSCENVETDTLVKILGLPIKGKVSFEIQATSDIEDNVPLWRPYQTAADKPSAITIPGNLSVENTVTSVIEGLLTTVANTDIGGATEQDIKSSLADKLLDAVHVGLLESKAVKSVSLLNDKLNAAKGNLSNLNLLGAIENVVSGALLTVGSLLGALGDLLTGCWTDTCKVEKSIDDDVIRTLITDSLVRGLLSSLDDVLSPLLQSPLLSLTETDLSLNALQCNAPVLVK